MQARLLQQPPSEGCALGPQPDVGILKRSAGHEGMLTQTLLVGYADPNLSPLRLKVSTTPGRLGHSLAVKCWLTRSHKGGAEHRLT